MMNNIMKNRWGNGERQHYILLKVPFFVCVAYMTHSKAISYWKLNENAESSKISLSICPLQR